MSKRLKYSPQGLKRALQVTRAEITIFIEGKKSDPYFFDRLFSPHFSNPMDYRIMRASEVSSKPAGGGKPILLDLFSSLKRAGMLLIDFKGSKSAILFVLDKDIDDVLRTRKRSAHVIYTESYDAEGEIFRHADVPGAIAAACSLPPAQVAATEAILGTYLDRAVSAWQRWVELCVAARLPPELGIAGYGANSKIHAKVLKHDVTLEASYLAALNVAWAAVANRPATRMKRSEALVRAEYSSGRWHTVFKGKWLGYVIGALVDQDFSNAATHTAGFPERLTGHAAQSVDYADPNLRTHYVAPLSHLRSLL